MKTYKYYSIIAAALAMGACSSDDLVGENNGGQAGGEGKPVEFTSVITSELDALPEENLDGGIVGATTRSTLTSGVFKWSEDDKVSISDGTLMFNYTVKNANDDGTCSFKVIDEDHKEFDVESSNKFYCAYPAAAVKGWNGETVTTEIYGMQDYTENKDGGAMGAYMVTSATVDGTNVNFEFVHTASVLEVNLSSLGFTPKAVYVKANNGVNLSGSITCNAETKAISVTSAASPYCTSNDFDVVGMTNFNETPQVARFYLLPVQIVGGVTVTVVDNNGNYYTKSTSTDIGTTSEPGVSINKGTAVQPYYKKVNFGSISATTRTGCWMATIPSNTHFNLISLPGAHNAATSTCSSAAKCQQYTIAEQLAKGVRAFDIRPGVGSDNLTIYHGGVSCNTTFATVLSTISSWLDANPTETVFVLVKPEKSSVWGASDADETWKTRVGAALDNVKDHIAMIGGTKTLNDVKGKMVVIAAEQTTAEAGNIGVGRVGWGSSYNDKTVMKGTDANGSFGWTLVYQDEYTHNNANTRLSDLQTLLTEYIEKNETIASRIYFNTANCETISLSTTINNNIVNSSNFTNSTGRWGILSFDFCGDSNHNGDKVLNMIINQNYKYLYRGRTRNVAAPGEGIGVGIAGDDYADDSQVYAPKR